MNRAAKGLEPACDWIARLAWVNLLFSGVSLAGGVVLGLFPASVALVSVLRSWLLDPESREQPVARRFLAVAWRERFRANAFGLAFTVIGVVMVLNLRLSAATGNTLVAVAACSVLLLLAITVLQLPLVLLTSSLSPLAAVRFAAVSGLAHPVRSLGLLALFVGWSYVLGRWPALLPFFGVSPLAVCAVAWNLRPIRSLVPQET